MIDRHRLPRAAVTALAATSPLLGDLRSVRLSRHLLQLRMLAQRAPAERTAALDEGLAVLAELQAARPEAVADVMGSPDAGAWSAWCLRRLSGGVTDKVPLAVDVAHIGALATSAAVSAGVDVETPVPIRAGRVHLPQLGRLSVAADPVWTVGTLTRSGERISITWPGGRADRDVLAGPHWEPIRRVGFGADNPVDLQLDDVSPYRRLYGYRPGERLSPAEVRRWRELVTEAATVLEERHPEWAYAVREILSVVVPLAARGPTSGLSATARDSIGAIALTMPSDGRQLALTLVHEVQHNYVNLLQNVGPLLQPDGADRYYSPWRDDARPLAGVLHGSAAFAGVADFWRRERRGGGRYAELEFALAVRQLRMAVNTLSGSSAVLTPAGRALTSSIGDLVADCETDPVDPAAARLAADLADDHEIAWQIRQAVRSAPGKDPGQPVVQSPLRRLVLRWMSSDWPRILARGREDPAGLDVLSGAYPAAAERYARRLMDDPDDPGTVAALLTCAAHTTPYPGHPADLLAALRDADAAGRAAILAPWIAADRDR
jgi:HEXXH motif-containing protein